MADTSVFSRLRRLFSTDVVIRNVGGNQIKTIDTDHIQSSGKYETNAFPNDPVPPVIKIFFLLNIINLLILYCNI